MKNNPTLNITGENFKLIHSGTDSLNPSRFPTHIHDHYELLFFYSGDISYVVEGKNYKLKPGDLVFTRPSIFHRIVPHSQAYYDRINILFDKSLIPQSIKKKIPNVDVFYFPEGSRVPLLLEKIEHYAKFFEGEELIRISTHIIEEIFYNLTMEDEKSELHSTANRLIRNAVDYIYNHLTEIKNLGEICDALYITKSHLHHLFISEIGVSPKQYIISKRLILAKKKIKNGDKPTEAAISSGFSDYATFFRNFKKNFGYSPSSKSVHDSKNEIL